uniref:Uncharacterized protein n=1 Tax=Solanum tuberosum TaxID=4113 RepID=M1E003_SOLTU
MVETTLIGILGSRTKNNRNESKKGRIKFLRGFKLVSRSGVAFRHTNLDWLPRYDINMGSVPRSGINIGSNTTYQYTNWLSLGSMSGPMTCGYLQAAIDKSRLEEQ